MNERQFELLMAKLEEIRCCIIDVEEETKKSSQQTDAADGIKPSESQASRHRRGAGGY